MNQGRTLFSQIMKYFPERAFQGIGERYAANKWVQTLR
jgi:hypothetical protein